MGLEGWEEGMTNRVPLDGGVVGLDGGEEGSSRSSVDEEVDGAVEVCTEEYRGRRPPASIRNE